MGFNKDAYKRYCREYREYWDWVKHFNEARYATNVEHGRPYDSKNMMHTFRLLYMAEEIATEGPFTVRRSNIPNLVSIREGALDYEDLVAQAEARVDEIEALFQKSPLPEIPNECALEQVMIEIRQSVGNHS